MKPTKEDIALKFRYDGANLVYSVDSGKGGRFKAGSVAGGINNQGVRSIRFKGTSYQAHQLIWTLVYGEWPPRPIRHINGNLDDNRLENLSMDSMARGKRDKPLDVERLREVLNYDPQTGIFRWKISPRNRTFPGDVAGFKNDSGYMLCTIDQQTIRLHRAAWAMHYGEMPRKHIDHINGARDDNRIVNLRLATVSENCQNSALRKTSKTGVKGVHFRKDTGKFSVTITVNKKTMHLGCFDKIEDAKAARLRAEEIYHPFSASERIYEG